jgi:membrane-bound lytic murein transglycosylase B
MGQLVQLRLGQCQFMPSNFHAYAVDKDGDGRADIWGSLPDVFASMGNFISTYCEWNPKVRAAGYAVEIEKGKAPLPKEVIGGYWGDRKVGLYKLNPVVTHSLKASGFNPWSLKRRVRSTLLMLS